MSWISSRGALDEQDVIRLYGTNHTRNNFFYTDIEYSPLERLRYNELILSVWLLLDACVLLAAALALRKGIDEIDSMPELADTATILHVHAQASRQVDVSMRRGLRPRDSIFVSLLVLATVMSATVGFASLAVWWFSWTNTAETACRLNHAMSVAQFSSQPTLEVPSEIQDWLRGDFRRPKLDAVHMVNNVIFMSDRDDMLSLLVAKVPYQEQQVFSHVSALDFQSAMSADKVHAEVFCCLYEDLSIQSNAVDSSDDIRHGTLRNLTLSRNHCSNRIRLHGSRLWVDLTTCHVNTRLDRLIYGDHIFYAIEVSGPLQLEWVATLTHDRYASESVMWGGKASCSFWLKFAGVVVYMVVLSSASFGLLAFWNMSVGAILAYLAIIQSMLCLDSSGSSVRVLGALVAGTAFLALNGMPWALPLDRYALVWILYAALAPLTEVKLYVVWDSEFMVHSLMLKTTSGLTSMLATLSILISTLVGLALDQPALYFMGLVGCIGSTSLLLWTLHAEYFLAVLGAIGATILGFHLKRHGTCLAFYVKRSLMTIAKLPPVLAIVSFLTFGQLVPLSDADGQSNAANQL
jgi:hypothetical protein